MYELIPRPTEERFFPDPNIDANALYQELLSKKEIVLTKRVEDKELRCVMTLVTERGVPGIRILASDGKNEATGAVMTPYESYANVRKHWYRDSAARIFEGRGIMKLATILIMIFLLETRKITRFSDFSSNITDPEIIFRSQPNGLIGGYNFVSTHQVSGDVHRFETLITREDR